MRHAERVMGTVVSFDLRADALESARVAAALGSACFVLHEADAVFSTWDPESPVSRLRRGEARRGELPRVVADVLDRCAEARALSGGWFDPWRMPGGVDPTGLVKGWALEQAAAELREAGVAAAMVNGGGDIVAFGRPAEDRPWRVGIRDPRPGGELAAIVEGAGAIATSGAYERGDHVLDPFSGEAATTLLSATVTGPDLALADALATGLLAAGEEGLDRVVALDGYEAFLLRDDGSAAATAGFGGETPLADRLAPH